MGKLLDDLRQAIESRQEFEEFKELKEKCLKVFEETIYVNMEMIGEIANNEWQKIYRKVHISTTEQQNIKDLFEYQLQRGHINRREFKEQLTICVCSYVVFCAHNDTFLNENIRKRGKTLDK